MNKNDSGLSKLANSTVVYMVGMGLSKILHFVILPYISQKVTTQQLGVYDVVQTISGLLVPILTLQILEAAFRFMFDAKEPEKEKVLTNICFFILASCAGFIVFGTILNNILLKLEYYNLLILYTVSNIAINLFQRIARSYDLQRVYAFSGILQTFVMLGCQVLSLKYTSLEEDGLVIAYMVSAFISCIYIEWHTRFLRKIHISLLDRSLLKKALLFSAPLVPNSISWWGVSSINRIIILAFMGYEANGIYAMSNKFAGLVTTVTSTFLLAFQEFAMTEKKNQEKLRYKGIFENYLHVLAIGTSLLVFLQQIYFALFINHQYEEAVLYIPIIMLSMFFSSISSFYGTGYFVCEKTVGAFKTTIIGAIVNIIGSLVLISSMGLWGVAIASSGAYCCMVFIRHYSMKAYFEVNVDVKYILICTLILLLSTVVFYLDNVCLSVGCTMMLVGYSVFFYRKPLLSFIRSKRL